MIQAKNVYKTFYAAQEIPALVDVTANMTINIYKIPETDITTL